MAARADRGARRSSSSWCLLARAACVTHPEHLPPGVQILVNTVAPPAISTATVSSALFAPDDDDGGGYAETTGRCRVESTDTCGHLLLSLLNAAGNHRRNLLVCRPAAAAAPAPASARFLPLVPEERFGLALSPSVAIGVLPDYRVREHDQFVVVQPLASDETVRCLCFTSRFNSWSVIEVAGEEERWSNFEATIVFDHGQGCLVFVDLNRGLLLFNPIDGNGSGFFLPFPLLPDAARASDANVSSTGGTIWYLALYDTEDATMFGVWTLQQQQQEEDTLWSSKLQVPYDELVLCDTSMLPHAGLVPHIGPIGPRGNLFFTVGASDAALTFSVEVRTPDGTPRRVLLCGTAPPHDHRCCCASEAVPYQPPEGRKTRVQTLRQALDSAAASVMRFGRIGWRALKKGRKHADKLPAVAQLIGGTVGMPFGPLLVSAATTVKSLNQAAEIGEDGRQWMRQILAPEMDVHVVGSTDEALTVIQEWVDRAKPELMVVEAAPGLTLEQRTQIRNVFTDHGAEKLLWLSSYDFVPRAPDFFD